MTSKLEEEMDEEDNKQESSLGEIDTLQPSMSQQCPFVFSKMAKDKTPMSSVLHRLKGDKQSKPQDR